MTDLGPYTMEDFEQLQADVKEMKQRQLVTESHLLRQDKKHCPRCGAENLLFTTSSFTGIVIRYYCSQCDFDTNPSVAYGKKSE